jgi:hypothetical protein
VARLKAASIINNIEVARQIVGEPALGQLLGELPEATRALFARRILALEWIEAAEWLPFQSAMLQRYFTGDEAAFRAYARKVCERDFNSFYKLIIRLIVSPESLLERTAKLWSTYADDGELAVAARDRQGARQRVVLKLSGFHTEHAVFGVLLHAFVEQLLQMSGARAVEVSRPINHVVAGAIETELHATWA